MLMLMELVLRISQSIRMNGTRANTRLVTAAEDIVSTVNPTSATPKASVGVGEFKVSGNAFTANWEIADGNIRFRVSSQMNPAYIGLAISPSDAKGDGT